MRYHYGLGVGHIYARSSPPTAGDSYGLDPRTSSDDEDEGEDHIHFASGASGAVLPAEGYKSDWEVLDDGENSREDEEDIDDDEFLAMYEMYR